MKRAARSWTLGRLPHGRTAAVLSAVALALPAVGLAMANRMDASPGPPPRVFAFISRADGRELEQLERHGARIDVAAPNWYALDMPTASVRGEPDRRLSGVAARVGVPLWPVFNGLTARSPRVCGPRWQVGVVGAIRAVAADRDHPGVTLDLEELTPRQRPCFTSLVRQLAHAMHADGRRLAVYAPRSDRAYDWTALQAATDLLVVSGYNEHWAGGRPGPVTTTAGFARVSRRAARVGHMGVAVAIGAFGYRWPERGRGVLIASTEGERLARAAGARVTRDDGEAGVRLPDGSEAWFGTARGLRARVAAVRARRLRWVAIFSLGREPERLWEGLDTARGG